MTVQEYDIILLLCSFILGMVIGGIGVGVIIYKWLTDHEEVEPQDIYGL